MTHSQKSDSEQPLFKPLQRVSRVFSAIAGLVILIMMLHICADVLFKYLFDSPIDGTLEIVSAIYMTIIVFFPLMAVTLGGEHIEVTLFTTNIRPGSLRLLILVVAVFCFLVVAAMAYAGFDQALRKTASAEAWETASGSISIWYARWNYPIGTAMSALAFGWLAVRNYRSWREH